jgi:TRAP transporter TAXI family solute receptor
MKTKGSWFVHVMLFPMLMVIAVMAIEASCNPTWGAELPKRLTIGTHPVGSTYNLVGTAISKVIGGHTDLRVIVKALAGSSAWMPLMDSKEVDLGVVAGSELYDAYYGVGAYKETRKGKGINVCLLQMGNKQYSNFVVRDDSPIKTMADVKGKRVIWGIPAIPNVQEIVKETLELWGLSENDYVKVKFNDIFEAVRALGEGLVDLAWIIPETPVVREVNSTTPLRFLDYWPTMDDPKILEKMQTISRGSRLELRKAGSAPGIRKDTIMSVSQIALAVRKDLNDQAVYLVAKALWENYKELAPVLPTLRTWSPENMVNGSIGGVPYHPGAIRFYKEVGAWTADMEKYQKDALAGK